MTAPITETPTGRQPVASSLRGHRDNSVFFSSIQFAEAVSTALRDKYSPFGIPVTGSGPPRTMYALQVPSRYGSRYLWLAPYDLHASPDWVGRLDLSTVQGIVARLRGIRTRRFVWNVRFDHEPLAAALTSLGFKSEHTYSYVVDLDHDYEQVFAAYSATTRNHVRKAHRRGVRVRHAESEADVHAYYHVHRRLVRLKQQQMGSYGYVYPVELLLELTKLRGTARLLLAEWDGQVIGGGLFVHDGCSIYYFHGASDRAYSHMYALCAVIDEAIRWACEVGAAFFNLSGAPGLPALEKFKSSWGTRRVVNWTFQWANPFWERLSALRQTAARRRI